MTSGDAIMPAATAERTLPGDELAGKAILILSLGSTQEFLAEARRTQDLWMGSFLMSYLMARGIRTVVGAAGEGAVVIPDVAGQPLLDLLDGNEVAFERATIANLPNVLTCIVPAAGVREIAGSVSEVLGATLRDIAGSVFEAVKSVDGKGLLKDEDRTRWEAQCERLLRRLGYFWASCAVPETEAGVAEVARFLLSDGDPGRGWRSPYAVAVTAAARGHSARKIVRDFPAHPEPEPEVGGSREKCTQCGIRTQVRPTVDDLESFRVEADGPKVKLDGRIRRGDRLCAVCMVKRLAWEHYFLPNYGDRMRLSSGYVAADRHLLFPSAASMATASVKKAVVDGWPRAADEVEAYMMALKKAASENASEAALFPSAHLPHLVDAACRAGPMPESLRQWLRLDGAWLFPESLDEARFGREGGSENNGRHRRDSEHETAELKEARKALGALRSALQPSEGRSSPPVSPYYAILAADGDRMGEWISGVRTASGFDRMAAEARLDRAHHTDLAQSLKEFALEDVPQIVQNDRAGRLIYAGGDDVLAMLPVAVALGCADDLAQAFGKRIGGATMSAAVLLVHAREDLGWATGEAHRVLKQVAKANDGGDRDALVVGIYPRSGTHRVTVAHWARGERRFAPTLMTMATQFRSGLSAALLGDLDGEEAGLSRWQGVQPPSEVLSAELKRLVSRHAASQSSEQAITGATQLLKILQEDKTDHGGRSVWGRLVDALSVAQFIGRESLP